MRGLRRYFPCAWSEEEAITERERDFPSVKQEDCVVVCDDCYKAMGLPVQ